jgi:tripartite-type tricarboxylate transporter receptor subunit TctC
MDRRRAIAAAMLLAAGLPYGASAQAQAFPSRTVRIIVPFGPGTGSDMLARAIGERLALSLGQPVVIENREGAGGVLGAKAALAARADGHTLMMAANPFVVSPSLYDTPPYDPLKDFVPLARVAVVPNVLVVGGNLPAKTVKELIALARASPGQLTYASSGKGTPSQLEMELLKSTYAFEMTEVPYKVGSQALMDVIGGRVAAYYLTLPAALPHIKAGKVRGLGVGAAQRVPSAPDIPTMAEALGSPGYEAHTWYGFVVPAGTPPEAATRLRGDIVKAMGTPEVRERAAQLGAEIVTGTAEEFARLMRAEHDKWTRLVRSIGMKAE